MRDANKRADHTDMAMGMETELAPYRGGAAMGYDNPEYGVDHRWTPDEAVRYAFENGLMAPLGDDAFGVDEPASNADLMAALYVEVGGPLDADEAARNSWRALLARNVGRNVLVRFLMGTQNIVTVEGELYEVGTDYLVIYQPLWFSHISADLYSVKFVEFREPPGMTELA